MQWLFSKAITRNKQHLLTCVPNRKRKHAAQASQTIDAELLIGGEQNLGITATTKAAAAGFQLTAHVDEVIDFAVEDDGRQSITGRHGLTASWREVDDRQAAVPETDFAIDEDPILIGTTLGNQISHRYHDCALDGNTYI